MSSRGSMRNSCAGWGGAGPGRVGWYAAGRCGPGIAVGQYISGIARFAATTNNAAEHAKVAALVDGFGEAIVKAKNPYAGKNAQAQWAAYVMDKYVVALVDAYQLSGVERARELMPIVIDKCLP